MQPSTTVTQPEPLWGVLYLGHWPAQAIEFRLASQGATYKPLAFAVLEQNPDHYKTPVTALSAPALALGLQIGALWNSCKKKHPGLKFYPRDPKTEHQLHTSLLQSLYMYTPEVSTPHEGLYLFNMRGTPLQRSSPLYQMPTILGHHIASHTHLHHFSIALSRKKTSAYILARQLLPGQHGHCPLGQEMSLFYRASAQLLPGLSPSTLNSLRTFGFTYIEQLAALSRGELYKRLGSEGAKIHAFVQGLDSVWEVLSPPPQSLFIRQVFPGDLIHTERLNHMISLAVDRFCFELYKQRKEVTALLVRIGYSDGKELEQKAHFSQASHLFLDILQVVRPLSLQLMQQKRLTVRFLEIKGLATRAAGYQLNLFEPAQGLKQEQIGQAVKTIRQKQGFNAIGQYHPPLKN